MSRIAYVNGRFVPHRDAVVHVEDRGYQFADGVYEVIGVWNGGLIDEDLHLARLDRSLAETRIAWPTSPPVLRHLLREMVARNRLGAFGIVYLQITRGVAARAHAFPTGVKSALVLTARGLPPFDLAAHRRGVAVVSRPDLRWRRCDIKSVALLPNVLAKQEAVENGAYEAWLIDADGFVREGTASNAWIVTGGTVVTHPADPGILKGVTRVSLLARAAGIAVQERPFSLAEAKEAPEAFLTSTTSLVRPVVRVDDQVIGEGTIGPVTEELLRRYLAHVEGHAGR